MGLLKEAVRAWLAESDGPQHGDQPCGGDDGHRRSWDDTLPSPPSPITNDMPPCDHDKIKFGIREFRTQVSKEFVILVFAPQSDVVYGAFIDADYETARRAAELFIGEQDLMGVLDGDIHSHNH